MCFQLYLIYLATLPRNPDPARGERVRLIVEKLNYVLRLILTDKEKCGLGVLYGLTCTRGCAFNVRTLPFNARNHTGNRCFKCAGIHRRCKLSTMHITGSCGMCHFYCFEYGHGQQGKESKPFFYHDAFKVQSAGCEYRKRLHESLSAFVKQKCTSGLSDVFLPIANFLFEHTEGEQYLTQELKNLRKSQRNPVIDPFLDELFQVKRGENLAEYVYIFAKLEHRVELLSSC